jgi:hypothetical protein
MLAPMRLLAVLALLLVAVPALAVPPGYRYVGSRVVSGGRVVYWYWDASHVEIAPAGQSFVAHMYARVAEANQERPYVAIVRCDARTYRDIASRAGEEPIDDGEPIDAVWRAGCDKGRALPAAARAARLGDAPAVLAAASPAVIAQAPPKPAAAPPPAEPPDPRRADACLKFADTRPAPAGDATITNACAYPIEVTVCYKGGGGGAFDCPAPARGKLGDSLRPGVSHVLPEYRRGRHRGINAVACRGEPGSVFPRLDEGGKSGCF